MDIFSLFKKKPPVPLRCTECSFEYELSPREARILEKHNAQDTVCPVREPCHICHTGFMIPVNYTDKKGNQYIFHEIKPKIKNLDPNTVMERIFDDPDTEMVYFFPPDKEL